MSAVIQNTLLNFKKGSPLQSDSGYTSNTLIKPSFQVLMRLISATENFSQFDGVYRSWYKAFPWTNSQAVMKCSFQILMELISSTQNLSQFHIIYDSWLKTFPHEIFKDSLFSKVMDDSNYEIYNSITFEKKLGPHLIIIKQEDPNLIDISIAIQRLNNCVPNSSSSSSSLSFRECIIITRVRRNDMMAGFSLEILRILNENDWSVFMAKLFDFYVTNIPQNPLPQPIRFSNSVPMYHNPKTSPELVDTNHYSLQQPRSSTMFQNLFQESGKLLESSDRDCYSLQQRKSFLEFDHTQKHNLLQNLRKFSELADVCRSFLPEPMKSCDLDVTSRESISHQSKQISKGVKGFGPRRMYIKRALYWKKRRFGRWKPTKSTMKTISDGSSISL